MIIKNEKFFKINDSLNFTYIEVLDEDNIEDFYEI